MVAGYVATMLYLTEKRIVPAQGRKINPSWRCNIRQLIGFDVDGHATSRRGWYGNIEGEVNGLSAMSKSKIVRSSFLPGHGAVVDPSRELRPGPNHDGKEPSTNNTTITRLLSRASRLREWPS